VAWQNINLKGKYLFAEGGKTLDIEHLMAPIDDYMLAPEKHQSSAGFGWRDVTGLLSFLEGNSPESYYQGQIVNKIDEFLYKRSFFD